MTPVFDFFAFAALIERPYNKLSHRGACAFIDTQVALVLQTSISDQCNGLGLTRCQNCTIGPVAQLGARMTGSHEVVGSIPTRSTKNFSPFIIQRG